MIELKPEPVIGRELWDRRAGVIGHAHLDERAGLKPADRRLRNAVGPGQIGLRRAFAKTLQCLRPLMGCQGRRPCRPQALVALLRSKKPYGSLRVSLMMG